MKEKQLAALIPAYDSEGMNTTVAIYQDMSAENLHVSIRQQSPDYSETTWQTKNSTICGRKASPRKNPVSQSYLETQD